MSDGRTSMLDAAAVQDRMLVDASGREIGRVEDVFVFAAADQPAWAAVAVGGVRRAVPLAGARDTGDAVRVTVERDVVATAPEATGDALEPSRELYEHYGLDDAALRDDNGGPTDAPKARQGTSRDPRGGHAANDRRQGHP